MRRAAWVLALAAAGAVSGQVVLRGPGERSGGDASAVSLDGVVVSGPAEDGKSVITRTLGWDVVRRVGGPLADQAAAFAPLAEKAWRARTRLERGDVSGAEPLFEDLFTTYGNRTGPTAAVVARGLTECRLRRGAQTSALVSWLSWVRCGETTIPSGVLTELIPDSATGLMPDLAPIWLDVPAVQALARAGAVPAELAAGIERTTAAARAERLGAWYVAAAKLATGGSVPEWPDIGDDAAIAMVADIVRCSSDDLKTRTSARQALEARLASTNPPPPAWSEAWMRVAVGRALLREVDLDAQRLGVVELLTVPARLGRGSAYLTGVAIAEAAVALHRLGDDEGADRLRGELQSEFAGHPALDWAPLRGWGPKPSPTASAGAVGFGTEGKP